MNDETMTAEATRFLQSLAEIHRRTDPPEDEAYLRLLHQVQNVLNGEEESLRPRDEKRRPGGVVQLFTDIPTILVPDLHARTDFLYSVFATRVGGEYTLAEKLNRGEIQVVCVGDAFHSERRGAARWQEALKEFKEGFKKHKQMDAEMRDSFGVMEMVILAKIAFPRHFHFLKGNHENIANESGEGNHGFRKYALEGPMVFDYVKRFYGEHFLQTYYEFEKNLPLLTVGNSFLVSHAEPATFYDRRRITNYRDDPEVIEGLTWTDNDDAEEGSVEEMLQHFLGPDGATDAIYFGGHRPVGELYKLRANNRFVQFHNPDRFILVRIIDGRSFDVSRDVVEIKDRSRDLLEKE